MTAYRGVAPSRRARVARLLERTGVAAAARRVPLWRGVLVLGYHRIGDASTCELDRTVFSADVPAFEAQLDLLASEFEVIGPGDLEDALGARRGRAVMITFDDGYRDQATTAAPLLSSRGLTATFFLTTGFVGGDRLAWWDELSWMARTSVLTRIPADGELLRVPIALREDRDAAARALHARYRELPGGHGERFIDRVAELAGTGRPPRGTSPWMDWDDVRNLLALGHSVGGHTVTHPVLARLGEAEQRREVVGCLERLRAETGGAIDSFAYPSGHRGSFDASTVGLLHEHGVRWAFSYRGGYERPGRTDPYDLRRVGVRADEPPALVTAALTAPALFAREAR